MVKVEQLWKEALRVVARAADVSAPLPASQSDIALNLLARTRQQILDQIGSLPTSINGWLDWTLDWLKSDDAPRTDLLIDVRRSINTSIGCAATDLIDPAAIEVLRLPPHAWLEGMPPNDINAFWAEILAGAPPRSCFPRP